MRTVSIDESGYTGADLLNADQPFQGACAIAIPPDEAERLIQAHFPKLKSAELKYTALARRPGNRDRLLALQTEVLGNYPVTTFVCDKRLLLLLHFLDYAAEPYYYRRGSNFCESGQNYSLASMLYVAGPALLGKAEFETVLIAFQEAVKKKTPQAVAALVAAVRACNWEQMPEALGPMAQADSDCIAAITHPGVTTDAAFVVLSGLVNRLETSAEGPYRIEHDESKNLLAYHALLQRMIAHGDSVQFKHTALASTRYPLKLTEVSQVRSLDSAPVQLADVLVGAAIGSANVVTGHRLAGEGFSNALELYRDDQLIHLLPSIDFEAEKAFRQDSQASEHIDYIARNLAK